MGYTAKELSVILAARRKSSCASAVRVAVIGAVMVGLFLATNGLMSAQVLAYMAFAVALLALACPRFNWGPKYEDLLNILESKIEH